MVVYNQGITSHLLLRSAPKQAPGLDGEAEAEGKGRRQEKTSRDVQSEEVMV
jgi:hypothetical protein